MYAGVPVPNVGGDRLKHWIQRQLHRYQLTPAGRLAINAILTMHQTSMSLLSRAAA